MPSTAGLQILVRKTPLTDEDWLALIEARRALIKPHLDTFTLPTLGRIECLKSEEFEHGIETDRPKVTGDSRFSLSTQGLFATGSTRYSAGAWAGWYERRVLPSGTAYVWGLARHALWLLAEIEFVGEPGRKERGYERVVKVCILESKPVEIAATTGTTPLRMWRTLGEAMKSWTRQREALWRTARALALMVETEELLAFQLVPGAKSW